VPTELATGGGLDHFCAICSERGTLNQERRSFLCIDVQTGHPTYVNLTMPHCEGLGRKSIQAHGTSFVSTFSHNVVYLFFGRDPLKQIILDGVAEREDETYQDVKVLERGGQPSRQRKASALSNDRRLSALWQDLDEGTISVSRFLRLASRCMENAFNQALKI